MVRLWMIFLIGSVLTPIRISRDIDTITQTQKQIEIMADARKCMPHILRWEGGFANIPEDKGGATMKGVTIATFRRFYGQDKTVEDLKNITEAQWLHIFKAGYWDVCKADSIDNQAVANIIVDWAYNSGPTTPIKRVQSLVGVPVDGKIGPVTLNAINATDQQKLFNDIWMERERFYRNIIARDASQRKFWDGWKARLDSLTFEA